MAIMMRSASLSPASEPARHRVGEVLLVLLVVTSIPGCSPSRSTDGRISPAEAKQFIGQEKTVCGEVTSTRYADGAAGQPTFLNFGPPYPRHVFTIVIFGRDRGRFSRAPEQVYEGAELCVTGQIATYQGKPQIVVTSPQQIDGATGSQPTSVLEDEWRGHLKSPQKEEQPSSLGELPPGAVRLSFWGAAQEVSGACHLLEARERRILLDCGQRYSEDAEAGVAEPRSGPPDKELPFEGSSIDAVLVSHVHLDHIGRLPLVYRSGYRGPIHATKVSKLLAEEMLIMAFRYGEFGEEEFYGSRRSDVAHTRFDCEAGAEIATRNRVEWSGSRSDLEQHGKYVCRFCAGLEAREVQALFVEHSYGEAFTLADGIEAAFGDAGHIPGSATISLTVQLPEDELRVAYTGDYGNGLHPYLRVPEGIGTADVLLVESTYGDQTRELGEDSLAQFHSAVREALDRKDRIVIPAFVLDRTQKVLEELGRGMAEGEIPQVPVYVTSPTANRITDLYAEMQRAGSSWSRSFRGSYFAEPLFHGLRASRGRLTDVPSRTIVVSSSSDGQYGASRELIETYAGDPSTTFISVGWSPPQSPTGQLREAADDPSNCSLRVGEKRLPLRARSVKIAAFSAHADQEQLLRLVAGIESLDRVFVVHGTPDSTVALAEAIRDIRPALDVEAPEFGDFFELVERP